MASLRSFHQLLQESSLRPKPWSRGEEEKTYFFPWDPGATVATLTNVMHAILAGSLAVLFILLTIGSGATAGGKWFRFYSYGTLLVLTGIGALSFWEARQLLSNLPTCYRMKAPREPPSGSSSPSGVTQSLLGE